MISVVVPSFNRAALLPATLDAILAQTLAARQVIVVDDGSTDGTAAMLAARYGGRVELVRLANGGDLAARNAGMALATGDLVAFCDSDDLWRPGYLAAMAGLWRAAPGCRVAFGNFRLVREDVWQATEKFAQAPPGFWDGLRSVAGGGVFETPIVEKLLAFQPFFPSAMVADRRFLTAIGGWDQSVGRIVGTDFATALRLAEHPPIGVLQAPLVGIRKHPENYSGDVQAMHLGDAAILEQVLGQRPSLTPLAREIRHSAARRRVAALEIAFARRDHDAVRAIHALLPASAQGGAVGVKARVAALPAPLRGLVAGALLAAGSWRAALIPADRSLDRSERPNGRRRLCGEAKETGGFRPASEGP